MPAATAMPGKRSAHSSSDRIGTSFSVEPTLPASSSMKQTISRPHASPSHATSRANPPPPNTAIRSALTRSLAFEFFGRRVARLGDPLSRDRLDESGCQDFQVQCEGTVLDVPDVVAKLRFPRQHIPPVNLRPAGDARSDLVPARLLRGVTIEVLHQERPGPDETHLAAQHVEEL